MLCCVLCFTCCCVYFVCVRPKRKVRDQEAKQRKQRAAVAPGPSSADSSTRRPSIDNTEDDQRGSVVELGNDGVRRLVSTRGTTALKTAVKMNAWARRAKKSVRSSNDDQDGEEHGHRRHSSRRQSHRHRRKSNSKGKHHTLREAAQVVQVSTSAKPSMRRRKTIKNAFFQMDTEHTGHLDFGHFLTACGDECDVNEVHELFEMLDEDGSGTVEKKELQHALRHNDQAAEMAERFPARPPNTFCLFV